MSTSKFTANEFAQVRNIATVTIPALIKDGKDYGEALNKMNLHLVQGLVGATLKTNKKGVSKFVFNKPLPHLDAIATIAKVLDNYVGTVELGKAVADGSAAANDMDIPDAVDTVLGTTVDGIPPIGDKITNKILSQYLLDPVGPINRVLDGTAAITIAAYGKAARKDANIKTSVIVGATVAGASAAAITAGVVINNKKKGSSDDVPEIETTDEGSIDTDVSDDTPVVEIPEDEIPEPEVDASAFAAVSF